jgi:hypothetical protein
MHVNGDLLSGRQARKVFLDIFPHHKHKPFAAEGREEIPILPEPNQRPTASD